MCNFFSYKDDDLLFNANVTLVVLDQIIFLKLEMNFVRIYILCIKMKKTQVHISGHFLMEY